MNSNCALILAAGKGVRLKPITDTLPKPLIQVGNFRLIEYHIHNLSKAGIKNIWINRAHLRESFNVHINPENYADVRLRFLDEPEGALETAGAIINAFKHIQCEQLIVVNGDIWSDFNFNYFNKLNLTSNVNSHILLYTNPSHNPVGDFSVKQGYLCKADAESKTYTFTGIGLYKREIFEDLPLAYSKLAPVLHHLINQKMITASIYAGKWMDIGTHERLNEARIYLRSIEYPEQSA